MKRQAIVGLVSLAWIWGLPPAARAADLRLAGWSFRFDTQARVAISVPLANEGPTDSGPILLRLWATTDPRSSTELTGERYLLAEETVTDGLAALTEIEVNTSPTASPESPPAGVYNIALTVDEQAADAGPTILSFVASPVDFPLPTVPSAAEVRQRVAAQIPCGGLFVQATLATLLGLGGWKWRRPALHNHGPMSSNQP